MKHTQQLVLNFGFTGCLASAQRSARPLYSEGACQRAHLYVALLCLLSGLLWNVGSVATLVSTLSPLGLTVGYPVSQCAVIVSSVAAIACFRERRRPAHILAFFLSVAVTAGGAALLAVYGACAHDAAAPNGELVPGGAGSDYL